MPAKDKGAIVKWSGGRMYYYEVEDHGGGVSSGSWVELGYIQESNLQDNTEQEDYQDETGDTVKTEDTVRVVKVNGLLMMSDKATMDFMKETVRGEKYYMVYKYEGEVNQKHQEIFFGICKFKPQVDLASGTKRPPFEITVLKNEVLQYLIDTAQSDNLVWSNGAGVSEDEYVYYTDANGSRLYQETAGAPGNLGASAPTHITGSAANGDLTLLFLGYFVALDTTNMNVSGASPFSIPVGEYYEIKETAV